MPNFHLFLKNPTSDNPRFNRKRGFKPPPEDQEKDNRPKTIAGFQKQNLARNYASFTNGIETRNTHRSLDLPVQIELVQINFLKTFNKDLKTQFLRKYGLAPVSYMDFNKTVLFEIVNQQQFQLFLRHVTTIINSPDNTSYTGKAYNLLALMLSFQFIGTDQRLLSILTEGLMLTLIKTTGNASELQKTAMLEYLQAQNINYTYSTGSPHVVEVHTLQREQLYAIVDNFDIIKTVTSSRSAVVRPGQYGEVRREFGFEVIVPPQLTLVGVIDSGFDLGIDPLRTVLTDIRYDHTNQGAHLDEIGHGSLVAGLVALGDDFVASVKDEYEARASIAVIKAIHLAEDEINVPQLINDIRHARRTHGIRLFNMSLNLPAAKLYNSGYSQFAYELDKLAHEEDIILFLSVGNYPERNLRDLLQNPEAAHDSHNYPAFFYDRASTSLFHMCEDTNICVPSDSLNNISVGALAGNIEAGENSDITPLSIYPAYYTRKFHWDFTSLINGAVLKQNQHNKFLNKPDLVFDGGDLFSHDAGIEVLRSRNRDNRNFYSRSCGTSLSTPLLCSYGAQILNIYPQLRTQTVKAILINAASYPKKKDLEYFAESENALLKSLTGFGKPNKDNLLATPNNAITFIIEDEIEHGQIMLMPVHLPPSVRQAGHKLHCKITLAYSFLPVLGNHLNYNPVHISFSLVRNVDIDTLANKSQTDYGIKKGFSWSEDHLGIENRIFSTAQSMEYTLQVNDLTNVQDTIAIAVRCLVKQDIPEDHTQLLEGISHQFSLAVTFTELTINVAGSELYSQMSVINDIGIIATGELGGEANLEAEVE